MMHFTPPRILLALALMFVLVGCGGPSTSTPEQTALAFYKAYRDNNNDQLNQLATREMSALAQMRCGGALMNCVVVDSKIPDGFTATGDPAVRVIGQTDTKATVELRYTLTNAVSQATEARCQQYPMQRDGSQWLVSSFTGLHTCADDVTATAMARDAAATAAVVAQVATSTAIAQERAANATATAQAQPTPIPEAFLTARQALLRSGLRAVAQKWSSDALLINVSFTSNANDYLTTKQIALDGTSRLWTFQFASKQLQKTISYIVQDGIITKDSGNDAASYKTIFAGKGEPFDIALEQYLDSDQAATIARENKATTDRADKFRMFLTINPGEALLTQPPAVWSVAIDGLFGFSRIRFNGMTGEIVYNDFGPTGSPGAIPTPVAATAGDAPSTGVSVPATDDTAQTKQALMAYLATQGAKPDPKDVVVAGEFARIIVSQNGDTAIAFYKKEGSGWKLLAGGSAFDPDSLQRLGIPQALWP